jgi:hypothetical protein
VLEVHGRQTRALAMGDFNDEPFDTSLVRHALSTRQPAKVTSAREEPLLWNLMWPIAGAPDGSFYFDIQPNMLDQLLVNKNMVTGDAFIKIDPATVQVFKLPARSIQVSTRSQSHSVERGSRSIRTDSPITSPSP